MAPRAGYTNSDPRTLDAYLASSVVTNKDDALRADIRRLGNQLGEALVRQHGQELLDLVERVRSLGKSSRRGGSTEAASKLHELLSDLSTGEVIPLVRAFTTYFYLANVSEQVHRADELAPDERYLRSTVDRIIEAGLDQDLVDEAYGKAATGDGAQLLYVKYYTTAGAAHRIGGTDDDWVAKLVSDLLCFFYAKGQLAFRHLDTQAGHCFFEDTPVLASLNSIDLNANYFNPVFFKRTGAGKFGGQIKCTLTTKIR